MSFSRGGPSEGEDGHYTSPSEGEDTILDLVRGRTLFYFSGLSRAGVSAV